MRINDISWQGGRIATFRLIDQGSLEPGQQVFLYPSSREQETLLSALGGASLLRAEPRDATARLLIEEARQKEIKVITWVISANNSIAVLCSQQFKSSLYFPDDAPLRVLLTERIDDDIPTKFKENPLKFLEEQFLLDETVIAQSGASKEIGEFQLIGAKWNLVVHRGRFGLQTKNLRKRKTHPDSERLTLLHGSVRFEDAKLASTQAGVISTQLQEVLQSGGSYLETWEIYNELETVLLQQQAAEFGELKYESWHREERDDSSIFIFSLKEEAPAPFRREELSIEVVSLSEHPDTELAEVIGETLSPQGKKNLRVRAYDESEEPPAAGRLRLSQRGDQARIKRRRQALDTINDRRAPLSWLRELLETGIATTEDNRWYEPLTERIKKLFPERRPTRAQEEALDIALNTPDIALIQGPPGTGKTTVIKALVARIAELDAMRGRRGTQIGEAAAVLITSHQHDAVETAVTGIDVGGLPAYRFSRRHGETDEQKDAAIQEWVKARTNACRTHLANLSGSPTRQLARNVDRLIEQWRQAHTKDDKAQIARKILAQAKQYVGSALVSRLLEAISRVEHPPSRESFHSNVDERLRQRLEVLIATQRTDSESFVEDGRRQAKRLLSFLEDNPDLIDRPIPEVIRHAADDEANSPDFGVFKAELIALNPLSISSLIAQTEAEEISQLDQILSELSSALHERVKTSRDAIAETLEAFVEELENIGAVRSMIQKYALVAAATCQQSVAHDYAGGKGQFEIVVVDEAARAHPLDLLIPLSRGKRVVLVGDHRQLPQMLEPEVKQAYQEAHPEADLTLLETSVFQRLYEQFKKIQDQGGPRRVTTLTDDFRMHPTISRFISHTFYKETPITSMCRLENREHGFNLYNGKPLCWIDVPYQHGGEDRGRSRGYSKSRIAEVEVLYEELEKILTFNQTYSIGVITFYGKQEELLERRRSELPFEKKERIRVGTVDSFQGKEFDVVLLSTVRSNTERQDDRLRVGFLESVNRLCVALSRSRRLMVTIGDADTVAGSPSEPAVTELLSLLQICKGPKGYYERR